MNTCGIRKLVNDRKETLIIHREPIKPVKEVKIVNRTIRAHCNAPETN